MGLRLNQATIFDILIEMNEARTVALEDVIQDFLDETTRSFRIAPGSIPGEPHRTNGTARTAGSSLKMGVTASSCPDPGLACRLPAQLEPVVSICRSSAFGKWPRTDLLH